MVTTSPKSCSLSNKAYKYMSVYSMTGYATVQSSAAPSGPETDSGPEASSRLGVEIRSVNSRFLDLAFRLPDELRQAEPALRELLTGKLKRGKVELRVSLESTSASSLRAPSSVTLQRLGSLEDNIKSWLPQVRPSAWPTSSGSPPTRTKSRMISAKNCSSWPKGPERPDVRPGARGRAPDGHAARPDCAVARWQRPRCPWFPSWWSSKRRVFWNAGKRPWPCPTAPRCRKSPRTGH